MTEGMATNVEQAVVLNPVEQALSKLVERGRGRGYLTWEELNDSIPDEAVDPDKLEGLMLQLDAAGVENRLERRAVRHVA